MELPEVIFSSGDKAVNHQLTKLVREGAIRKLVRRAYTSNLTEAPAAIVRRNLYHLIGGLYPGSLISHRTAIEFKPSPEGAIYLSANNRRTFRWPGVKLVFTDGPPPREDDHPIAGGLFVSSLERACLENLLPARRRGKERRTLPQSRIEERLLQLLNSRGERGLNAFRDRAHELAETFEWLGAYDRLSAIVSSLLSTKASDVLTSPLARARAFGRPYDSRRVALFNSLALQLRTQDIVPLLQKTEGDRSYRNFAFFESYFSNYIEGTTFRVDEARQIVFEQKIIVGQREDSHDVAAQTVHRMTAFDNLEIVANLNLDDNCN